LIEQHVVECLFDTQVTFISILRLSTTNLDEKICVDIKTVVSILRISKKIIF